MPQKSFRVLRFLTGLQEVVVIADQNYGVQKKMNVCFEIYAEPASPISLASDTATRTKSEGQQEETAKGDIISCIYSLMIRHTQVFSSTVSQIHAFFTGTFCILSTQARYQSIWETVRTL